MGVETITEENDTGNINLFFNKPLTYFINCCPVVNIFAELLLNKKPPSNDTLMGALEIFGMLGGLLLATAMSLPTAVGFSEISESMVQYNTETPAYYSDSLMAKLSQAFFPDENPYYLSRETLMATENVTRAEISHSYNYTLFANCTANSTGGLFVSLVMDVFLILFIPFTNFGGNDRAREIWWNFIAILFLADFFFLVWGIFWIMTAMKYLFFLKFPDECIEATGKFYSVYLFQNGKEGVLNGEYCGETGDLGAHGKILQNLEFITIMVFASLIFIGIASSVKNFYLLLQVRDDYLFNLKQWSTKRVIAYIQNTSGEEDLVYLKIYCPNFEKHAIMGKAIDVMNTSRLTQIGITNVGHQIVVMKEFQELLARSEEPSWKQFEERKEFSVDDLEEGAPLKNAQ